MNATPQRQLFNDDKRYAESTWGIYVFTEPFNTRRMRYKVNF